LVVRDAAEGPAKEALGFAHALQAKGGAGALDKEPGVGGRQAAPLAEDRAGLLEAALAGQRHAALEQLVGRGLGPQDRRGQGEQKTKEAERQGSSRGTASSVQLEDARQLSRNFARSILASFLRAGSLSSTTSSTGSRPTARAKCSRDWPRGLRQTTSGRP